MLSQFVFDRRSYNPVGFARSAVFIAKEYLHRRPERSYTCDFVKDERRSLAGAHLETLQRDGIVVLKNYFKERQLEELQNAFEQAVKDRKSQYEPDALNNEDVLVIDPSILKAALDDFLLQIIGGYYGKPFGLGRASASRLFPSPAKRVGSHQWHHDTRGRQIHLMILLSDVSERGQRMSYLRGSHDRYYDRFRGSGEGSRFEQDVNAEGKSTDIVELAGSAGTIGLFDSNGLHSGNRNENEPRDSMLFCYISYPRHFKAVSFRRADLDSLSPAKRKLITANPRLKLTE